MSGDNGMLVFVARRDELVEEPEEFVDLYSWEVGVVAGVFHFKRVCVFAFPRHHVWQGVEAWVAYWDADGVVAFFLQEFD